MLYEVITILMTIITLTAGTAFIMWLGEQITERGIGNGISLIIFAGIVAGMPAAIAQSVSLMQADELKMFTRITSYNVCYTKLLRVP